jgi:hypothetical protein
MRIFFLTCIYILMIAQLSAQPLQSGLLHKLLSTNESVPQIFAPELTNLFPARVSKAYSENKQYLIKTNKQLFLGIDGTGQLYEIKEVSPGVLDAIRVDSTLYAGNNFCAAIFSIDSSIFSFGGYGFWKTNGALKQYNFFSHEWDVIPLFEERPSIFCQKPSGIIWKGDVKDAKKIENMSTVFAPSFYWVDKESKHFYAGVQHLINQSISDSALPYQAQYNTSLSVLDLATKKWTVLGDILSYGWHYTIHLPWGLLVVESSESVYVNDFKTNRQLYCKDDKIAQYRKFFRNRSPNLIFYANEHIYFGDVSFNSFDSISVSKSDFEDRNTPLFKSSNSQMGALRFDKMVSWIIFLLLALGLLGLYYFFIRKKRTHFKSPDFKKPNSLQTQLPLEDRVGILNEMERQFILYLFDHSIKGTRISVEEVNKLTGVVNKNEPIKRRTRSELINAINDKWLIIAGSRDRLVLSEKSEFDGRTREYFINQKVLAASLFQQFIRILKTN